MSLPNLLTTEQAAAALGLTAQTLETWRSTRRYTLGWVKVGRLVRYREEEIARFLSERTCGRVGPKDPT